MPTRLTLLCAGATAAAREGRFADADAPLDDGGRAKVRALALPATTHDRCFVAPGAAARETAALSGLAAAAREEPALRDMDHGAWAGQPLDRIDPAALAAWLAAPERGAPGGEGLAAVLARVGPWLDGLSDGHVLAITHPAVLRAAIAHVMGVPVAATLAIDIAPLSLLRLSRHDRWRLRELRRGA